MFNPAFLHHIAFTKQEALPVKLPVAVSIASQEGDRLCTVGSLGKTAGEAQAIN